MEDIQEFKDISSAVEKFQACMNNDDESFYKNMPLNLGDMMVSEEEIVGKNTGDVERKNFMDFDYFDLKEQNKLTKEQIERVEQFQKVKYCIRVSGIDRL